MKIQRWIIALLVGLALIGAACGSDETALSSDEAPTTQMEDDEPPPGPGDPAVLEGIETIQMLDASAVTEGGLNAVVILSETEIAVEANIGPVCTNDEEVLQQQPGAVTATYGEDEILVFIDRFTRNCSGDDAELEALIQLTLNEPIDSREIVIEVNCP